MPLCIFGSLDAVSFLHFEVSMSKPQAVYSNISLNTVVQVCSMKDVLSKMISLMMVVVNQLGSGSLTVVWVVLRRTPPRRRCRPRLEHVHTLTTFVNMNLCAFLF